MHSRKNDTWGPWAQGFWAGIEPDPLLTVAEWADRHRWLSAKGSAEAGQWRTSRTPYLREIMDCLSEGSGVWSVTMMAGAQLGKTEAGNNWLGYVIDMAPAPTMAVWPTQPMAQRVSRTRIDPMISESPRLRQRVATPRSRDAANTVELKEFPGGLLVMVGANSPTGLRSMPIKNIFLDEVDAYPGDVGGEGDPCELAEARARNFKRRKMFRTSTPTMEGLSRIKRAYMEGDQRLYFVPCPHCQTMQVLSDPEDTKVWQRLRWDAGKPETARFACASCGVLIEERYKTWMLQRGEWRPQNAKATDPRVRSYHISTLYSPWFTWEEVARKWEKAKGSLEHLKAFVNTILGETWKEASEAPKWQRIYNRREKYRIGTVPNGGRILTAGVDVQKDRLEVEVVAWGINLESWSVDYLLLDGDTSEGDVWGQLEEVLAREWEGEDGHKLKIARMAVDSGYQTQVVYNWVRTRGPTVLAVKGRDGEALPIIGLPVYQDIAANGRRKIKARARAVRSWPVGVSTAKHELYGWLRRDSPTDAEENGYPLGWCHFPEYSEEYFKQLCAEAIFKVIDKRGFPRYEWRKTRERNEALDARVYARAAAAALGIDRWGTAEWDERSLGGAGGRARQRAATEGAASKRGQQRRSEARREGFLDRWHGRKTT